MPPEPLTSSPLAALKLDTAPLEIVDDAAGADALLAILGSSTSSVLTTGFSELEVEVVFKAPELTPC
jgi:hypothetical protein